MSETSEIRNPKDFSRCSCGGKYILLSPNMKERQHEYLKYPAFCQSCNAFRYLSDTEYYLARNSR